MATIKFFQTSKKGDLTFEVSYLIDKVEFDKERFAAAMSNKLLELRLLVERAEKSGRKIGFSVTKPLWFEFNSGATVIKSDEVIAKNFKTYIKGRAGENTYTKTEIKEQVLVLIEAMEIATNIKY